jgi:hypothetical protein
MSAPLRSPVARLLGSAHAAGGPFALLGIRPEQCTDEMVLEALERQSRRLDAHVEGATPEADEVRLALHAAAAQLLDPLVRRRLVERWTGVPLPDLERAAPPVPGRIDSDGSDRQRLALEHDIVLTLGVLGGWGPRSLRRVAWLSAARGIPPRQLADSIRAIGRAGRGAWAPRWPIAHPTARTSVEPDPIGAPARAGGVRPTTPPDRWSPAVAMLLGVLVLMVTLMGSAVVLFALPARPAAPAGAGSPAAAEVPAPAPSAAPDPVHTPPRAPTTEVPAPDMERAALDALASAISASVEALSIDPEGAMERFAEAVGVLSRGWCDLPPDRAAAAADAVLEFCYRAGRRPSDAERCIEIVSEGSRALRPGAALRARDVRPAAWSVAMLTRLSQERDLSAAGSGAIERALSESLGRRRLAGETSFAHGASAALALLPERLAGASDSVMAEGWSRWMEAVAAVAGQDASEHTRLLVSGLETLLLLGPEPDQSRGAFDAASRIASAVDWSQSAARAALMRWFADRRVSAPDLHAVTLAIATRARAPGTDLSMVLSAAASERSRASLREQYAAAWGIASSGGGEALRAWTSAAQVAIADSYRDLAPAAALGQAVVLSRINEAAEWVWRGGPDEALALLLDPSGDVQAILSAAGAGVRSTLVYPRDNDGVWALRYLSTRRNIPVRIDMLDRLDGQGGPLGSVDAEVLVQEALMGAPIEVRLRAQDSTRRWMGQAVVVNAALELLPRMPRALSNAALIEEITLQPLPRITDPAFAFEARRALVDRLLEVLAAEGELSAIDSLAQQLALSYAGRAAGAVLATGAPAPEAYESASALWRRWIAHADRLVPARSPGTSPEALARARAGRLRLAHGTVQRFAGEQVSLAEVMAYVTVAEDPLAADRAAAVIAELTRARRASGHVFTQVLAAERAMAQLWLLRLGAPRAWDGQGS